VSNGVLVLPKGMFLNNWVLHKIDKGELYFTVYEKNDGEWGFSSIQTTRFVNKADLVKEDKDKYPNLIFIHKKLFCGSSTSFEEAIKICVDSIDQHKRKKRILYSIACAIIGFV